MVTQVLVALELCPALALSLEFSCPQWRTAHRAWDDSPLLSRSVASVFADSMFLDSISHAQKEVFVEKLYLY